MHLIFLSRNCTVLLFFSLKKTSFIYFFSYTTLCWFIFRPLNVGIFRKTTDCWCLYLTIYRPPKSLSKISYCLYLILDHLMFKISVKPLNVEFFFSWTTYSWLFSNVRPPDVDILVRPPTITRWYSTVRPPTADIL